MKNGPQGESTNIDLSPKDLVQQSLMFETPSAQIVEDSKQRILKQGFKEKHFDELLEISEAYDKLRHLKT